MTTINADVAKEVAEWIRTEAIRKGRTEGQMAGWLILKGMVYEAGHDKHYDVSA